MTSLYIYLLTNFRQKIQLKYKYYVILFFFKNKLGKRLLTKSV